MDNTIYKLMLVTHRQNKPLTEYLHFVEQCIAGGITCVQLREKDTEYASTFTFGKALQKQLQPHRIPLIINDNLELALALNADGLHLGQKDACPSYARKQLGPDKIIGVSIDTEQQLLITNTLAINYVGVGAIFPSTSKPDVAHIWTTKGLQHVASYSKHPIVAIGGIDEHNAKEVISSGADGVAVIAALHNSKNVTQTTTHLRTIINHHLEVRQHVVRD